MDTEHLRERCQTFLARMKLAVHIHRIMRCTLDEAFERAKIELDMPDDPDDIKRHWFNFPFWRGHETVKQQYERFLAVYMNAYLLQSLIGGEFDDAYNFIFAEFPVSIPEQLQLKGCLLGRTDEEGRATSKNQIVERFYGTGVLPSFGRAPWKDALIGDHPDNPYTRPIIDRNVT